MSSIPQHVPGQGGKLTTEQSTWAEEEMARRRREKIAAGEIVETGTRQALQYALTEHERNEEKWKADRLFAGAAYLCGASLAQIGAHLGITPQSVGNKIAKVIPRHVREALANRRRGRGAVILSYARVGEMAEEFYAHVDEMAGMTLGDVVGRLTKVRMEDEGLSRICGGADVSGIGTGDEPTGSGEPHSTEADAGAQPEGVGSSG